MTFFVMCGKIVNDNNIIMKIMKIKKIKIDGLELLFWIVLLGWFVQQLVTVCRWHIVWPKICQSAEFLQSDGLSASLPDWVMRRDILSSAELLLMLIPLIAVVAVGIRKMFRN